MKTKLIRNLKPGDKFKISSVSWHSHEATVEVARVQETRYGLLRKRRWEVIVKGGYPWWWGCVPVSGYHNDRIELV